MTVTDIDQKTQDSIYYLQLLYTEIERRRNSEIIYPITINYKNPDPTNYDELLFFISSSIQELKNYSKIHRLFKLNDEVRNSLIDSEDEKVHYSVAYTISEIDTTGTIESKFGVEWRRIAEYNNIDSTEIVTGLEINIPFTVNQDVIFNANNIPVFDLQEGEKILGTDLGNDMTLGSDGDIEILTNINTFTQGIQNLIDTTEGALPFNKTWGFNAIVGDEIPREAVTSWIEEKVKNSFLKDERVDDVTNIVIENATEGYNVSADIYPKKGIQYITVTTTL